MQDPQHTLGRYGQPSMAGMLAHQRQGDIAHAAERHRVVAIALAGSIDNGRATGAARARTLDVVQSWLATVRLASARALRQRSVASHTSGTVTCCA